MRSSDQIAREQRSAVQSNGRTDGEEMVECRTREEIVAFRDFSGTRIE